ncbi:hypothetical protein cypCar_00024850 [Cyprinus carpio]|nr:hypothetical protein cypCar_00024850 [Cyprinus carpio]
MSKARASLPLILYIDRFLGGVFTKRRIPKRTQFGPIEGPLLYMLDPEKEGERAEDLWFDLSNEERCNWMMFVRPAQNHLEQNLVAYQYGSDIFYTTIKNIQPKQELKVWYAASYAEFVSQKVHDVTDEERKGQRAVAEDGAGSDSAPQGDQDDELLASVDKLPFEERTDGALNGLKVVEMAAESMETETEEGLDTPATHTEELQEEGDSFTPPPATEVPGSAKEDLSQTSPEDPHLTPQDMRRARRIRVKKHVRSFHSEKIFQCTECDKAFCRPDKLRLHMLRHSDRKDFLCSTCGKQFKRKDKLREHMQRMHNPEREAKKDHIHRTKALKQKEPTTDFESFMFKCRLCMMGFRRRGMLVNHLSKRHPEMRLEEVPELTLPIIKPNRDYFCQYCDKVYKSASKRKAHILKNHPGAELPPSIRKLRPAGPGEPDPMLSTHTQLTGTIATAPVCCPHCAKQYSSKTKMVQHIRKKHPEYQYSSSSSIQAPLAATVISSTPAVITTDGATAEAVVASSPHSQHSTVDVSQLHDPHSYSQHSIQVQHIQVAESTGTAQASAQVSAQPLSPSSQQAAQELSNAQLTPVTLAQGQTLQTSTSQTQGAAQHAYLPSNWNYRSYPSEIQMMALPHTQYVIAEASTPVTAAVNSSQVQTTHYVISEGQTELDGKQVHVPSTAAQVHHDPLEQPAVSQQTTTQYIITTTTNGTGASEVHITKP